MSGKKYEVPNFYNSPLLGKSLEDKYKQKAPEVIKHPARVMILGTSGRGKTNAAIYLIMELLAWNTLTIFASNPDQDLVRLMKNFLLKGLGVEPSDDDEIPEEIRSIFHVSKTIDRTPEDYDPKLQHVVLIDDLTTKGDKTNTLKIASFFKRGRPANITPILCTQYLYDADPLIRSEVTHLCVFPLDAKKNITAVFNDYGSPLSKEKFFEIYHQATLNRNNGNIDPNAFLMISKFDNDLDKKFRRGFTPGSLNLTPKDKAKQEEKLALVDDEDVEDLRKRMWRLNKDGYAETGKHTLMHREVTKAPKGSVVDHIDGDKLNNTKDNLRIVSQSVNMGNRASRENKNGYPGVKKTNSGKYSAAITLDKKYHYLGSYNTPEEAAEVYATAKRKYEQRKSKAGPSRLPLDSPEDSEEEDSDF